MSVFCRIFGHLPVGKIHNGGEYMRVTGMVTDGIGRVHATLFAECPRCGEQYRAGMIHVPPLPRQPADQSAQPQAMTTFAELYASIPRFRMLLAAHELNRECGHRLARKPYSRFHQDRAVRLHKPRRTPTPGAEP